MEHLTDDQIKLIAKDLLAQPHDEVPPYVGAMPVDEESKNRILIFYQIYRANAMIVRDPPKKKTSAKVVVFCCVFFFVCFLSAFSLWQFFYNIFSFFPLEHWLLMTFSFVAMLIVGGIAVLAIKDQFIDPKDDIIRSLEEEIASLKNKNK